LVNDKLTSKPQLYDMILRARLVCNLPILWRAGLGAVHHIWGREWSTPGTRAAIWLPSNTTIILLANVIQVRCRKSCTHHIIYLTESIATSPYIHTTTFLSLLTGCLPFPLQLSRRSFPLLLAVVPLESSLQYRLMPGRLLQQRARVCVIA
jgi:hypothetical protein